MNRGPRLRNRNVTINEEDEEEKIKKAESKKAIIRADFEKHKKEMKLNVSDASKMNEIKLKNQLEELLTANARKKDSMNRLEEYENNLERENLEATMFSQTVARGNKTKYDGENSAYLSIGFHPNRTTTDIFGMTEFGEAEVLSQKKMELEETLNNIELLTEQEGEILGSLQERLEEIKKNKFLLSKRRNELQRMNHHADKRFFDLQRIDYLARNKEAATSSHLKELKDNLTELQKQESTFMKQKEEDHQRETQYVINKQNEMADVLIELDQRRVELLAKQEELRKLELQYEEMKDKRKTTRIVTKYIHTFDALEQKRTNLLTAHLQLKELLERQDSAKSIDVGRRGSPTAHDMSRNSSMVKDDRASPNKRNSFVERNLYIDQIQNFYEHHPEGPNKHVDKLIDQYAEFCFRDQSLNSNYEELQDYKAKKEHELTLLRQELGKIKNKNEYITLGRTGSKIIEKNEQEAIDSGMLKVNTENTTINQAKFEYENKRDADNYVMLYTATETFVLRCYLDSVEMMSRLSKVLSSIYTQSEHSSGGGFMPEELRDLAKRIKHNVNPMKKIKRSQPKQDPSSQSMLEGYVIPELQRTHTNNTNGSSEKDHEGPGSLDLNEVYEMFLSIFEGYEECAPDFVHKLKSDVFILSFVSLDEIRAYLLNSQQDFYMEQDIGKVIEGVESMRDLAIEHMTHKFDVLFQLYCELSSISKQATEEADDYLKSKGVEVSRGSLNQIHNRSPSNSETMGFVKTALAKKWSSLKTKYQYDPDRDYRREQREIEQPDQNSTPRQKLAVDEGDDGNKANWDSEDLRAKISEIVGSRSKKIKAEIPVVNGPKTLFRGRTEEDHRRLQMKKDKEKQKQAMENMSDEDFLNYQRRQIKGVTREGDPSEVNEGDLFRKAQADQVSRLAQKAPIEELKRMIDNSKVLSKIQILERKKGITDGKKDFKQNTVENYIPVDPKVFPKSSLYVASSESKFRPTRDIFTPNVKYSQSRLYNTSERNTDSDFEDSPKDMSFKGSSFKAASRFKPRERPLLDVNTEPTLDYGKPYTAGTHQRMGTIEGLRRKEKMPFLSEATSPNSHIQEDYLKKNKLLISSIKKKSGDIKSPVGLPKLEKQVKKKPDGQGKKKKKNNNNFSQKIGEAETLNAFINLQTDPTLKMVYSPSFFATSFPATAMITDFNYKFDAFKFQAPSLLIAEKL